MKTVFGQANPISRTLWTVSFFGLALFIPFSISGDNISLMLGFAACLIAMALDADVRRRYAGILRDPLFGASLLLVISALPAVLMSDNRARATRDWRSYWILIVYFFAAYNLVSPRLRRMLFWALSGSASLASVVALIQYAGGFDLLFVHIASEPYRPSGTLYTMTFAGILYQVIVINFAVLLGGSRPDRRAIVIALGLLLQIAAILLTLTRGAWLAVFAGAAVVPILLRNRAVVAAGAIFVLLAGAIAFANPQLRDRAATMMSSVHGPSDKNISTRLVLWDVSWEIFTQHPLLGVGMGDYSTEADARLRQRKVTTTVDTHNIYLHLLATRGLVGFLPFVLFWAVLFRVLFDARRRLRSHDRFGYYFTTGTIAAAVAVLVGALSENNIDDSEVFTAFMFVVGMARSFRIFPSVSRPGTTADIRTGV